MDEITRWIMKIIPRSWHRVLSIPKQYLFNGYLKGGYSLHAEDRLIYTLLADKKKGFYVDIGAWHPFLHSNTYLFYKKNWCGINVDILPGSMKLFKFTRSRDINLERGISDSEKEQTYYQFEDSDSNTFEEKIAESRIKNGNRLINKKQIKTMTLKKLFDTYLPSGTKIDFLSIDVEGHELSILRSNDWDKYVPKVIVLEELELEKHDTTKILTAETYTFLVARGYELRCVTPLNLIFYHNDSTFKQGNLKT